MGIERPNFNPNVNATRRETRSSSIFLKVPKGGSLRVRFTPKKGSLWVAGTIHHGFRQETNPGGTVACLKKHGTETTGTDCWTCRLVEYLKTADSKIERKLVEGMMSSINTNTSYYAQVWLHEDDGDGGALYTGPWLLSLPKTGAERVGDVLDELVNIQNLPHFTDPDEGQDIIIRNSGEGPAMNWYSAKETGETNNLDNIAPKWVEKFIEDIYPQLQLRVYSPHEQYTMARKIYDEEINWDAVETQVGIPEGA